MRRPAICALLLALLLVSSSYGGMRPLLPGEQIVYQTVQSGSNYRTFPPFVSQITGNAYTEYGDEVILGGTARYVTNIAVGTQTFFNAATPAYMDGVNQSGGADPVDTGGFLELSIYLNDGPPDPSGNSAIDASPHGNSQPGTLLARSRVPTPVYPQGGVSPSANGANNLSNPADNNLDPWIVEFPFAGVLVPNNITFALINLNRFGLPDGHNSDGNQFGVWHALASTTNTDPDANFATHNNNTAYNTNAVGQSRTGTGPYTLTYSGQWTWAEYNAQWESTRATNNVVEATIYASSVPIPEPSSIIMAGLALVGLVSTAAAHKGRRARG